MRLLAIIFVFLMVTAVVFPGGLADYFGFSSIYTLRIALRNRVVEAANIYTDLLENVRPEVWKFMHKSLTTCAGIMRWFRERGG